MKKSLLIITLLFTGAVAFSQAKLEIGLKAGANFANTNIQDISTDAITAFHGGAYVLVKLAAIGIQPEILYSSQGSSISGVGDINLDYVNIPIMVKFYLPLGFNLQAGPQFGFLTNAKDNDGTDLADQFKDSDTSLGLGAGWDAPFGLNLTARYLIGLSDINNVTGGGEVNNQLFQLSVGYSLFKLGR